ncbi:MAG: hypothetical protein CMF96_00290 [Candidatus Marinimicrobia bacterium]|nr:hypothetical protein [Candidatus Neomarinimicrobiota bacterium]
MENSLYNFIKEVRIQKANHNLVYSISIFIFIYVLLLSFLGGIEYTFHFEKHIRLLFFESLLFILFSSLFYLIARWIIQSKSLFGNYSDSEIAQWIGEQNPEIADRLLNCIQLERTKTLENEDLVNHAIKKLVSQIESSADNNLNQDKGNSHLVFFSLSIFIFISCWNIFKENPENAIFRILNPNIEYEIPVPFKLISITKNQFILGGDTTKIKIAGTGILPDSIDIYILSKDEIKTLKSYLNEETYSIEIPNIKKDLIVWGLYESNSWFSPWNEIKSKEDTIFVQDRPIIEKINFTIISPEYTKLENREHPGNITNISLLPGSKIKINAEATKSIVSAKASLGKFEKKLFTNEKLISGIFSIFEDDTLKIKCVDENGIDNNSPTHFNIQTYIDMPPEILIFEPKIKVELNESMEIPLKLMVNDDFGISKMMIEYSILHPDYLPADTNTYQVLLDDFKRNVKSQNFSLNWDIDFLSLMPEDEIHFRIGVADNNIFPRPSWSFSKELKAYYPSLEEMFFDMEEDQSEIIENVEEINLSIDEVQELVEDLKLDLLKSEDMDWEQTQQTEEIIQKMENVFEEMAQMSEVMDAVKEQIEKNDLLNENLTEKFQNLQELLNQLMTPEMKEALEKMRDAAEELDPEKMLQALEEFEFNAQDFEEQLDRFIEMFELAMAEQKMDEIQKKLEQMINEQQAIMEELKKEDSNSEDLAAREKRQQQEIENLQNTINDAQNMMEDISPSTSENMDKMNESNLMENAEKDIDEAQKEFSDGEKQKGGDKAQSAKENLEELASQFSDMKKSFQMETVAMMTKEFQRVVHNILSISKDQEEIFKTTKQLKSKSPILIETAVRQNDVQRQMRKLMDQVMELSTKTFYITPEIGKMLGRTILDMNKSIGALEQKQITTAKKHQNKATETLNDAAYVLLDAMSQMNSSGSASGMEQFMEQMAQMSQQQQGINQGTMQMGQMGMMAQQAMMQQLMQQQQALQQSLEELLGNNPSKKGGGLEKARQDMEEVIKDFKKRKVDQRTIDRQEKILSRMLDSQRSMTQRDLSKKRKSKEAEEFLYIGPDGLPLDYGERKLILMEAMEQALQEGYSQDYNKMIREYFQALQEQMETEYENQ